MVLTVHRQKDFIQAPLVPMFGAPAPQLISDAPAMLFRMLQSFTNKSVWMVDHFITLAMLVDLV
jgi:hypothetical protein